MGYPTKYDEERLCRTIVELMAEGASIGEVCAEYGVSRVVFYKWVEEYEAVAEAKEIGEQLSEAWWMKKGRVNLENKDFNYSGWFMNMKNRHGWTNRDAHTLSGPGDGPVAITFRWADGNSNSLRSEGTSTQDS